VLRKVNKKPDMVPLLVHPPLTTARKKVNKLPALEPRKGRALHTTARKKVNKPHAWEPLKGHKQITMDRQKVSKLPALEPLKGPVAVKALVKIDSPDAAAAADAVVRERVRDDTTDGVRIKVKEKCWTSKKVQHFL